MGSYSPGVHLPKLSGARAFLATWVGQLVSTIGTSLNSFGLQLFVYSETGSVGQLSYVALAYSVPAVSIAPFAGAVVDRIDRRLVMLIADTSGAFVTLGLVVLAYVGSLELWIIYTAVALTALIGAFHQPAWLSSVPTLVPRPLLGRANGLMQLSQGIAFVSAPAIAGALLVGVGLEALLIADLLSFGVGIVTLLAVQFPHTARSSGASGSLWKDVLDGWRYLWVRRGLLWLLWMYAGVNFSLTFVNVLLIPLTLSFASQATAGVILSAAGAGTIAGGLTMAVWGGPRRRIVGVLGGVAFAGLCIVVAGIRPNVLLVALGVVLMMFSVPIVNASGQVIWQTKIAPSYLGRVFALRRMTGNLFTPIAVLLTGPLADRVFEPLLSSDGSLAGSVGAVIGTGDGRGIGFLLVISGLVVVLISAAGTLSPKVRLIESALPDEIPEEAKANV